MSSSRDPLYLLVNTFPNSPTSYQVDIEMVFLAASLTGRGLMPIAILMMMMMVVATPHTGDTMQW